MPKKQTPWTKKNLHSKIKAELRLRCVWHWEPRRQALERQKMCGGYVCPKCNRVFKNLEADHIKPVSHNQGGKWDWIDDLFCDEDNWQALCHECHKKKTASDSAAASRKGARQVRR